jgi:Cu+-exporting ATPase
MKTFVETGLICHHCGESCPPDPVLEGDFTFCCEGCRMVYQLLDTSGLCNYYRLNDHPGINRRLQVRQDKFAFLDDPKAATGLITFQNEDETHAQLYLPQIHCSSCLYLLEQLHRLQPGVISSRVDFAARQVSVVFDHGQLSLRGLAELLTSLGYEPYISLRDAQQASPKPGAGLIYPLGVAGFCFANIMLISFPEYLGLDHSEPTLQRVFRYLNLFMSLPVVLYSARPFYLSAWKGLQHRFLNIDAPIVLAIAVAFIRSIWEVLSGHGSGYFDSMSGIVFFMLVGRVLQDKTYRQLSFDRDYRSYFPVAVTVVLDDKATGTRSETIKTMQDLRPGDTVRVFSGELIPADGILTRGTAFIDYSFVTGESEPIPKQMGELVYAGGRQTDASIEMLVVREVAQSYLTQLWNRQDKRPSASASDSKLPSDSRSDSRRPDTQFSAGDFSFVHPLSRYFTYIVLVVASIAALYWELRDPSRVWTAVTAVLIVACPCALLLSSTFTNGNLLRILGRNHFYLRNAEVIERLATANHLVFDKTGTLTESGTQDLAYTGQPLTPEQATAVAKLAAQSSHPLSRALHKHLTTEMTDSAPVKVPVAPFTPVAPFAPVASVLDFRETPGAGIKGIVDGLHLKLGSPEFIGGKHTHTAGDPKSPAHEAHPTVGTRVYIAIDTRVMGYYELTNHYRQGLPQLVHALHGKLSFSLLSGDNARESIRLQEILGKGTTLLFNQKPLGKSRYIDHLQRIGRRVMMIGDGLNDAGALQQSDVGIALTADCNNFTPASDAILRADQLHRLPAFLRLCRAGKKIILLSFVLSVLYNLIGLSFAVSGTLSPMVAAILMPSSSVTILLVTYGCSNIIAGRLRL